MRLPGLGDVGDRCEGARLQPSGVDVGFDLGRQRDRGDDQIRAFDGGSRILRRLGLETQRLGFPAQSIDVRLAASQRADLP